MLQTLAIFVIDIKIDVIEVKPRVTYLDSNIIFEFIVLLIIDE